MSETLEGVLLEGTTREPRYSGPLPGLKPSLFRKMAEIQGKVGSIEPDQVMEVQGRRNYHYISESKLLHEIRPLLAAASVAAFVSVDTQGGEVMAVTKRDGSPSMLTRAQVTTSITFADGDSGEMFTVYGQGQGNDPGDKAIYKAITSACRYMWWKALLVGTDAEDAATSPNEDYALQAAGGAQTPRTPQGAAPPAPAQAPAPRKPSSAQKTLYRNLLKELNGLSPTRDWEATISEWILGGFGGRGIAELSSAEYEKVTNKLEATRDKLREQGVELGTIGASADEETKALEEAGLAEAAASSDRGIDAAAEPADGGGEPETPPADPELEVKD